MGRVLTLPSTLPVQYPEGYLEALANKEKNRKRPAKALEQGPSSSKIGKSKRKSTGGCLPVGSSCPSCMPHTSDVLSSSAALNRPCSASSQLPTGPATTSPRVSKKSKLEPYTLPLQQANLIKEDKGNAKLWDDVLSSLQDGPVSHLGPTLLWASLVRVCSLL